MTMTKYDPSFPGQLYDLFKGGRTITEVCQKLGITRKTYWQWKKDRNKKAFRDAAEFAEEAAEAWWAQRGRLGAIKKEKLDAAIFCFTMKTRFKWRETDDDKKQDGDVQPLAITFNVAPPVADFEVTNAKTDA